MKFLTMHTVILATVAILVFSSPAIAQDIQPASETAGFVFNSSMLLISGLAMMFMAAGFCLLQVGLAQSKNAATICLNTIAVVSIAGIMFWLTGYNILYNVPVDGLLTPFMEWWIWQPGIATEQTGSGHSSHASWYFQMVFAVIVASIVAGALAERIKFWSFLVFTIFLTGFVYPIQASWEWGQGYLHTTWQFADFAGSTLIHSTGGWAVLAGVIILGPRTRYVGTRTDRRPASSVPLATLGTFILWLGWFGINGGSRMAAGSTEDILAISQIFVNTNASAAAGVLAALVLTSVLYKKVEATAVLYGAIGGLVSISAEPLMPAIWQSLVIGAVGGAIVTLAIPLLDRFRIDDAVGAISAHLLCGIWGTLVVVWSNNSTTTSDNAPSIVGQLIGIIMIGVFVFTVSSLIWLILKHTIGIRVISKQELSGLDGTESHQETVRNSPAQMRQPGEIR